MSLNLEPTCDRYTTTAYRFINALKKRVQFTNNFNAIALPIKCNCILFIWGNIHRTTCDVRNFKLSKKVATERKVHSNNNNKKNPNIKLLAF